MTIRALPYFRRGNSGQLAYPEDTANWEKAWNILSNMATLRTLRVVILDKSIDGIWEAQWLSLEDTLLEPVKAVLTPGMFEVMLPYATCRVDRDMGQSKCVLKKPHGHQETVED
jgi:hypothetical protein